MKLDTSQTPVSLEESCALVTESGMGAETILPWSSPSSDLQDDFSPETSKKCIFQDNERNFVMKIKMESRVPILASFTGNWR